MSPVCWLLFSRPIQLQPGGATVFPLLFFFPARRPESLYSTEMLLIYTLLSNGGWEGQGHQLARPGCMWGFSPVLHFTKGALYSKSTTTTTTTLNGFADESIAPDDQTDSLFFPPLSSAQPRDAALPDRKFTDWVVVESQPPPDCNPVAHLALVSHYPPQLDRASLFFSFSFKLSAFSSPGIITHCWHYNELPGMSIYIAVAKQTAYSGSENNNSH